MSLEEEVEVNEFEETTGGRQKSSRKSKRHGNASLRAWVTFVKKVQKEEKLSYRDAMMRAKVRKDKGEKWMKGGDGSAAAAPAVAPTPAAPAAPAVAPTPPAPAAPVAAPASTTAAPAAPTKGGGKKYRRKSHKKGGSKKRRPTRRR